MTTGASARPESTDLGVVPAVARPHRQPIRARLGAVFLILPGVAWLAVFFLVPLVIIAIVSLGTRDATGNVLLNNPTLNNYLKALRPQYLPALGHTIWYAGATTILSLLIGYPIAYWISRYGGRRKSILLVLVMLPFWTSYLIRTYAWMIILRDNGVVNSVLQSVGLISEPLPLLNTDLSVIFGMTYGFLPFAILPLFVSIDRLDPHLVEAGRDLYADGRGAFLNVTLPLTMPGVIAAGILTFIPAIGDYVTPTLLGGAQTNTIANVVQVVFTSGRDWPNGSALGFLLMAVTLIGTLATLRWIRSETFR